MSATITEKYFVIVHVPSDQHLNAKPSQSPSKPQPIKPNHFLTSDFLDPKSQPHTLLLRLLLAGT